MANVVRSSIESPNLAEMLERILDKGIVIDAWVRVTLIGIELLAVEARVVITSIDKYLQYAEAIGLIGPVARPPVNDTPASAPAPAPAPA
jgi:gas vesicle structural protein